MTKIFFEPINETVIPRSTKKLPDPLIERKVKGLFAEALLFGDQINIAVNGPNLQVVTLFRWLGKKMVEDLIEQNIINFTFYPGTLTYLTQGNIKAFGDGGLEPGLNIIIGGHQSWDNPFEATSFALEEQLSFDRRYRRYFSRLIEKHTKILSLKELWDHVIDSSKLDVREKVGASLGFKGLEDPDSGILSQPLISNYIDIAHSNLVIYLSSLQGCNEIFGSERTNELLGFHLENIVQSVQKNIEDFRTILEFERLPNLGVLIDNDMLTFDKILKLRKTKDGEKFRMWLGKLDKEDKVNLLSEYYRSMMEHISSPYGFKMQKIIIYCGIGLALMNFDPLIGLSVGTSLNLFDAFLLERLKNDWTPKSFIRKFQDSIC